MGLFTPLFDASSWGHPCGISSFKTWRRRFILRFIYSTRTWDCLIYFGSVKAKGKRKGALSVFVFCFFVSDEMLEERRGECEVTGGIMEDGRFWGKC